MIVWSLVGLVAMVWNTGGVVAAKMRVQAVADGAALAATTWTSRTTNLVTGANRMIVRLTSAQALAAAVPLTARDVKNQLDQAEFVGTLLTFSIYPATVAAGRVILAQVKIERALLISWGAITAPAVAEAGSARILARIADLYEFQVALIRETPRLIERQRQAMEAAFRCEIVLTQPRHQGAQRQIEPPLKRGGAPQAVDFAWLVHEQVLLDRRGWEQDLPLRGIILGRGTTYWRQNTNRTSPVMAAAITARGHFHVLSTHSLAAETGNIGSSVTDQHRIRFFTVLAAATPKRLYRPPLFYQPIFSRPVRGPVAYAQGETYNSKEAAISLGVKPWRVWTPRGWHWRPRLSYSDGLFNALQFDRDFAGFLNDTEYRLDANADLRPINLH